LLLGRGRIEVKRDLDTVDDEQANDVVRPDDDDVHHPQTAKVLPKGILEEGKGDFRQTMQAAETTVSALVCSYRREAGQQGENEAPDDDGHKQLQGRRDGREHVGRSAGRENQNLGGDRHLDPHTGLSLDGAARVDRYFEVGPEEVGLPRGVRPQQREARLEQAQETGQRQDLHTHTHTQNDTGEKPSMV